MLDSPVSLGYVLFKFLDIGSKLQLSEPSVLKTITSGIMNSHPIILLSSRILLTSKIFSHIPVTCIPSHLHITCATIGTPKEAVGEEARGKCTWWAQEGQLCSEWRGEGRALKKLRKA